LTIAAGCAANAEPAPFQPHSADYRVLRGGSPIGRLSVELQRRDDGLWHYRIESEATAWYVRLLGISTTESAWFAWRDGAIVPLTYHHVSREPGADRFWQHQYDWQQGISRTRTHAGDHDIELEPGTVDPLTLRLAVLARLRRAGGPEDFALTVLERDAIEAQRYEFIGRETLRLHGRCYPTVKFRRFRKEGSSRNYIAWHAPELGWLALRIAHTDDGKPIVLELDALDAGDLQWPGGRACQTAQPS